MNDDIKYSTHLNNFATTHLDSYVTAKRRPTAGDCAEPFLLTNFGQILCNESGKNSVGYIRLTIDGNIIYDGIASTSDKNIGYLSIANAINPMNPIRVNKFLLIEHKVIKEAYPSKVETYWNIKEIEGK